jgi:serine phosphatase RsbU (regulator of sigma subunit)/ligand-binding sensor domain-containing protein
MKIFLIILFLLFSNLIYSQKPNFTFEQLTDQNGRSIGTITGIDQDEDDFLWVSTRNGLYQYDGYQFKKFHYDLNDSTSIPSNDITNFYIDSSNILWLRYFDKYAAFKNEKTDFNFDILTNKKYNFQAKIIEDKGNNLWVGPSKDGIFKFNIKDNTSENYKEYPLLYSPELYVLFDSIVKNTKPILEVVGVENDVDTIVSISITKPVKALLVSVGEVNYYGVSDFGFLMKNGELVWEMDKNMSKHAGGDFRNNVQIETIELDVGEYLLGFKTDNSHSWNNWDADEPDKTNFYGIKLIQINDVEERTISKLLEQNFVPKNAISSNNISDIITDQFGNIHLVSEKGISFFDTISNGFSNIEIDFCTILNCNRRNFYVTCLLIDSQNQYWIGTSQGLIKYDHRNNTSTIYKTDVDEGKLSSNVVYTIFQDSKSNLWVGTENGLNFKPHNSNKIYHYHSNNNTRLYDNKILKVYEDQSGNIWIGTMSGLNKLKKEVYEFIDLNIEKFNSYPIIKDKNGVFWYHGKENYLFGFDRKNNSYLKYELSEDLFPLNIYFNERNYKFNDLIYDGSENIWIAIGNNLCQFNILTKQIKKLKDFGRFDFEEEEYLNQIIKIYPHKKQLIIFSSNRITVLNKDNSTIIKEINYPFEILIEDIESNDILSDIQLFNNEKLLLRTKAGIYFLNLNSFDIEPCFLFSEELKETSFTKGNIKASNNSIVFALYSKLFIINQNNNTIDTIDISGFGDVSRTDVFIENNFRFWVYTDNGLFIVDINNNDIINYSTNDGLRGNNILGIVDDKRGNLLITTSRGISKFNKEKNEFIDEIIRHETKNYFVNVEELQYKNTREILFLLSNGFLSFFPDDYNDCIPLVKINSFLLHGIEFEQENLISNTNELEFDYDENFFEFGFSALDYTDPTRNQYAYILEGLDKDTTYVDASHRKAKYTSVPHGKYKFSVIGSNNDNVWNYNGSELFITIHPPFWKTWWFVGFEVLILILCIYFFIKYRERKLQKDKQILEKKVQDRTVKIRKQKEEIEKQHDKIAEQNRNITDSITYASRIQTAILPPDKMIQKYLADHFILYKPRDIVSGDYYWFHTVDDKLILIAADCTGHGVPGAFMSMLGVALLNELISNIGKIEANKILNQLRGKIKKSLRQTGAEGEAKDGMDLALCIIDMKKMELHFSGAHNPLYQVRDNELITHKADKMPIGVHIRDCESFTNTVLELKPGDCFYMFSDGYVDQFGGEKGKKFMSKKFKQLILENHTKSMTDQKTLLDNTIEAWKGEQEQVDDILVIGFRIEK